MKTKSILVVGLLLCAATSFAQYSPITDSIRLKSGTGTVIISATGTKVVAPGFQGDGASLTGMLKSQVGLGNVDNTSDANKPVSTAQATAIALKQDAATAATLTGTQTLTHKTLTSPVVNSPTGIVKGDVGLGSVDNTSDAGKPVSTAQAISIATKQDIATALNTTTTSTILAAQSSGVLAIPNLTFWVAADSLTGTTGQSITTWPDLSGNGNHLTQGNGIAPKLDLTGFNGMPALSFGVGGLVTGTGFFTSAYNKAFSYFIVQKKPTLTISRIITDTLGTDSLLGMVIWTCGSEMATGDYENFYQRSGFNLGHPMENPAEPSLNFSTYNGTTYQPGVNNQLFTPAGTTVNLDLRGALRVGDTGSQSFDGMIAELMVFNRGLTSQETAIVQKYLCNKWGISRQQIVFFGDSRTEQGSSIFLNGLPNRTRNLLGGMSIWGIDNLASSGKLLSTIATEINGQTKSGIRPKVPNVAFIWAGVNDRTGGQTSASIYASAVASGSLARLNGWRVVVATDTPGDSDSGHEAVRIATNALIRANWQSFADAVADFGLDPIMGLPGSQNNTTYYKPDKIHPIDAGTAILAGISANAIRYALGLSVSGSAALTSGTATIVDPNITTTQTIVPSVSGTGIVTPLIVSAQVSGTAIITSGTTTDSGTIRYTITP